MKTYRVVVPIEGTLCYEIEADSELEAAAIATLKAMGREPHTSLNVDSAAPAIAQVK